MLWKGSWKEVLAMIETASFFEEARRKKDIVESVTGFVKSKNNVAPSKKHY